MTVEEIEIIVTAKVEEALKEFEKFLPAIKEKLKQVEEAFQKIDTKKMTNKLQQSINFIKKKMQDFNKSSTNNEITIKVNNKEAEKQITQLEKEIDSLQKKITGRQLKLDITNTTLDKIRNDTNQSVVKEMPDAGNRQIKEETYKRLDGNTNYNSLVKQSDKLNNEIEKYNELLNVAKSKMAELNQQTIKNATANSKMNGFFSTFKNKVEQTKPSIASLKNSFYGMPKITQNVTNNIKNIKAGVKSSLGHVLKYAGALFSMQGIYSTLSSCANTWLSSQNAGAKQLSTNINYMKYAMGSAFAPVIQYVTGLVYQLMKAIQSVVYALFRVNIFAKASASSYASMAGNAKKAKNETKQLAGIHGEINNVQSNDNSDSGSGGDVSPNFDLSGIDNQMTPLAQKLYDFFKPLADSWKKYGPQVQTAFKNAINGVGQAISSMWGSVESLFTNGTIYSVIDNVLNSIGKIGVAWAKAWNNNNNGTKLIQGIANMINDVTKVILNLVSSTGFQKFLDGILEALSGIVKFIEPVVSGFFTMTEKILEIELSAAGDVLKTIGKVLQAIAENEKAIQVLKAVGVAIAVLQAPIPAAIYIFKNWGNVSEWLGQKFSETRENINNAFQDVGKWFNERKDDIYNAFKDIGPWFSDKFTNAVQEIKKAFATLGNFFKEVRQTIYNIFENISSWFGNKFAQAWQAVKNAFSTGGKIFDGIKEGILNGLKATVNAIIKGINKVISIPFNGLNSALTTLKNTGIGGMKPFSWITTVAVPKIPELAKGNVAYDKTLAIFGEYAGASNNPEITTPQNIMRDTFEDVLSNYGGNGQPVHVTIQYLGKEIFDDTIDYINSKTRRTGKNTIVTVGD